MPEATEQRSPIDNRPYHQSHSPITLPPMLPTRAHPPSSTSQNSTLTSAPPKLAPAHQTTSSRARSADITADTVSKESTPSLDSKSTGYSASDSSRHCVADSSMVSRASTDSGSSAPSGPSGSGTSGPSAPAAYRGSRTVNVNVAPFYAEDPGVEGLPSGPVTLARPTECLAGIMGRAILASRARGLSLEHLYRWIEAAYPFFTTGRGGGWRNSVRHTLSIHKMFDKVERTEAHPMGKGGIWQVVEGEEVHWEDAARFVKTFPPDHPHNRVCKHWNFEQDQKLLDRLRKQGRVPEKVVKTRRGKGGKKALVSAEDTTATPASDNEHDDHDDNPEPLPTPSPKKRRRHTKPSPYDHPSKRLRVAEPYEPPSPHSAPFPPSNLRSEPYSSSRSYSESYTRYPHHVPYAQPYSHERSHSQSSQSSPLLPPYTHSYPLPYTHTQPHVFSHLPPDSRPLSPAHAPYAPHPYPHSPHSLASKPRTSFERLSAASTSTPNSPGGVGVEAASPHGSARRVSSPRASLALAPLGAGAERAEGVAQDVEGAKEGATRSEAAPAESERAGSPEPVEEGQPLPEDEDEKRAREDWEWEQRNAKARDEERARAREREKAQAAALAEATKREREREREKGKEREVESGREADKHADEEEREERERQEREQAREMDWRRRASEASASSPASTSRPRPLETQRHHQRQHSREYEWEHDTYTYEARREERTRYLLDLERRSQHERERLREEEHEEHYQRWLAVENTRLAAQHARERHMVLASRYEIESQDALAREREQSVQEASERARVEVEQREAQRRRSEASRQEYRRWLAVDDARLAADQARERHETMAREYELEESARDPSEPVSGPPQSPPAAPSALEAERERTLEKHDRRHLRWIAVEEARVAAEQALEKHRVMESEFELESKSYREARKLVEQAEAAERSRVELKTLEAQRLRREQHDRRYRSWLAVEDARVAAEQTRERHEIAAREYAMAQDEDRARRLGREKELARERARARETAVCTAEEIMAIERERERVATGSFSGSFSGGGGSRWRDDEAGRARAVEQALGRERMVIERAREVEYQRSFKLRAEGQTGPAEPYHWGAGREGDVEGQPREWTQRLPEPRVSHEREAGEQGRERPGKGAFRFWRS
ncbi:hypothetical protein IAT38_001032 [Cryptococcus sp. DSM 104549]